MRKNDAQVTLAYAGEYGFLGAASYSPLKHVAVIADADLNDHVFYRQALLSGTYQFIEKGHVTNIGAGYYLGNKDSLLTAKHRGLNSIEFYTGMGKGRVDHTWQFTDIPTPERTFGNYNKIFVQFDFGHRDKTLAYGFVIRYSELYFKDISYADPFITSYRSKKAAVTDIAGTASYGFKNIKVIIEQGFSYNTLKVPFYQGASNSDWGNLFMLGLQCNFSPGNGR